MGFNKRRLARIVVQAAQERVVLQIAAAGASLAKASSLSPVHAEIAYTFRDRYSLILGADNVFDKCVVDYVGCCRHIGNIYVN